MAVLSASTLWLYIFKTRPIYCGFQPHSIPVTKAGEVFSPHVTEGETEAWGTGLLSLASPAPLLPSSQHWG